MPMTLNVGASRKIADGHYGSRGASVNLEVELDAGLATDAAKLQERIRQLFSLARQALAEELANHRDASMPSATNGHAGTSGKSNDTLRPASQAQIRALVAIAKGQNVNLSDVLRERYGLQQPQELLFKQASEMIDLLKASDASPAAQ